MNISDRNNLHMEINTQTTETEEEETPSWKQQDACVFTLHGNLRPKSLKHKSLGDQMSQEKVEAVIQRYGTVAYGKASQATCSNILFLSKESQVNSL